MDYLDHLPQDIISTQILRRLDYTSRVRARAVCRAWKQIFPLPIPDTLWLLIANYGVDDETTYATGYLDPYPTSLQDIKRIGASSDIRKKKPIGAGKKQTSTSLVLKAFNSSQRYMMVTLKATDGALRRRHYLLYNPFTRESFQLPCTFRNEDGKRRPVKLFAESAQILFDPPNCIVAVRGTHKIYDTCVYFYCQGVKDWVEGRPGHYSCFDMIIYQGELYLIKRDKIVAYCLKDRFTNRVVMDLKGILRESNRRDFYLVECDGKLMVVVEYWFSDFNHPDSDPYYPRIAFEVYKIDLKNRQLVKVDNLGDKILFIKKECSQSWSRPEYAMTDFTSNSIYFTIFISCKNRYHLGRFQLDGRDVGTSFAQFYQEDTTLHTLHTICPSGSAQRIVPSKLSTYINVGSKILNTWKVKF